jgi:hypothetical protein
MSMNACVTVKKRQQKQKEIIMMMATLIVTQMLVGEKNNIHCWMWLSCIPNQSPRWLQP